GWKFWNSRPALRQQLEEREQVLVVARVSKHVMPVRVSADSVFHEKVVVLVDDSFGMQAVLSSGVHRLWASQNGSTLGTNSTNYSITDAFETFALPAPTRRLDSAGDALDETRRAVMLRRELSLTQV